MTDGPEVQVASCQSSMPTILLAILSSAMLIGNPNKILVGGPIYEIPVNKVNR